MNLLERFPPGQPVPSPCVGICRLTPDGQACLGCHRTMAEIADWSRADDDTRRAVWARVLAVRASGTGKAGP